MHVTREAGAVLVVGGTGTVGTALAQALRARGVPHHRTARTPAPRVIPYDLARPEDLAVPAGTTSAVVLAGRASLAECHEDPAGTTRTNVDHVTRLAVHLHDAGVHPVVASTNLVFDGSRPDARPEDDLHPVTEYGRQKAAMEAALRDAEVGATVVRFTKVLGDASILTGWADALRAGHRVEAFHDLPVAPVPASWAARVLLHLCDLRHDGTWHASPRWETTYHLLAVRLAHACDAPAGLVQAVPADPVRRFYDVMPRHARMEPRLPEGCPSAPGPDALVMAAGAARGAGTD